MTYEIELQVIKSLSPGIWEFKWEGKYRRSFQETIALVTDAETEEVVFEKVLSISENTLKVLSVSKAVDEEQIALEAMIDYCTNLVGNRDLIISLQGKGITISNN